MTMLILIVAAAMILLVLRIVPVKIVGDASSGAGLGSVPSTDLLKSEDAAFAGGDAGVMAMTVRDDVPAATAGAEGDYQPALTDSTGRLHVDAAPAGDGVMVAGVLYPLQRAVISAASSGDNTLLAAQTGPDRKIRVISMFFIANGTVTARLESGAGGTALTGQMDFVAQSGLVLPRNDGGWVETAAAALLNLELSGAVEVAGAFTYIAIP